MTMLGRIAAAGVFVCLAACGSPPPPTVAGTVAPLPRRTVIWLGDEGVDQETAERLQRAGVDLLVAAQGSINLAGRVPVLRLTDRPPIAGSIPVAMALRVDGIRADLDEPMAGEVWQAIIDEVGEEVPAEIILDVPRVPRGVADFVRRLSDIADVPVVPILTVGQLREEEAQRVAAAARSCVVPAFGTGHPALRGAGELANQPLSDRLGPLAALGVRVRLAVSLQPVTVPALAGWGDDLDVLTEVENADVSTTSVLDRTFVPSRALDWSGRTWQPGESIAARWFDVSRLHTALAEMDRLVLPVLAGWDLVPLPPLPPALGIDRESLVCYLEGEGPEPQITVTADRTGRTLTVAVANRSVFGSSVSAVSNWVEVSVVASSLVVEERGSFDRTVLGTHIGDEWSSSYVGVANAVRFFENYLAPGEELVSGPIRLARSDGRVRVVWHVSLASGAEFGGELSR